VLVTADSFAAVWKVPIELCMDVCLSKILAVSVYALMQSIEISSAPLIPVWAGWFSFCSANWTEFVYQTHKILPSIQAERK
jgi:hypothetical protein